MRDTFCQAYHGAMSAYTSNIELERIRISDASPTTDAGRFGTQVQEGGKAGGRQVTAREWW